MVLHQSGVAVAPVGRLHADAAFGFLHHDCEDQAWVDVCVIRDRLDHEADRRGFVGGVVGPDGPDVDAAIGD
jgi:hypothetical protein